MEKDEDFGARQVEKRNIFKVYLGVSKNRGTPKWMVYNGTPY